MESNEEKRDNKIVKAKLIENLIISIVILLYFILINVLYIKLGESVVLIIKKVMSIIMMLVSIIIFEIAYHKDSGKLAINGIEALVFAVYTLTIWQVIYKINVRFDQYTLFTGVIFEMYYILKSLLIFTREKRRYLKSLSDIHEIVQKEPTKKEAKKKKNKENIEN